MGLGKPKAGPIGIDFGSHALRVLQLAGRGDQKYVLDWALHLYPPHASSAGADRADVIEALRTILKSKKFAGKQVVTALGQRDLAAKSIRLPEIPESELAAAVEYEAAERIKGLDEDSEIRFIPSGTLLGESERQQEVLVLAAKAPVVRDHLDILTELGLESVGIDAAPCAIFRPFERYLRRDEDQDQINAFIDIGQQSSWIVIARGSQIVLARSVDVGGAAFDRLVSAKLTVDANEVGQLRRRATGECPSNDCDASPALDPETLDAIDQAEKPAWEKLGREIGLCIRYFAVTFRGARPNSATCVGGESLNHRGLERLSEATGMACRVGFPLRNMKCARTPLGSDTESLAAWATCAGLSMKPAMAAAEKVLQ